MGISFCFFFFKQKTAYEMRISDWSSDVCSSDLRDQQDDLIRRVFDADFQDYVMEHDIDHAYPNALWTLVVLAGMHLEQKGIIENFEHRTDDDRDQILRSEERRVGKEYVSTSRYRWSPYNEKKKRERQKRKKN